MGGKRPKGEAAATQDALALPSTAPFSIRAASSGFPAGG